MTTSGSYDFNVTTLQIIKDALLLNGALDPINGVSNEDRETCLRFLNMAVKHAQMDTQLWVETEVTHTLTPGTESYTVGDGLDIDTERPLRLRHCRRRDSGGNEIPVDVVSRQDYMDQPTKSTESAALMVYYDPQLSNGVLYVWPTGSATDKTIILTFKRPIQDFDNNGDNPDFPVEWSKWLVYQLAADTSHIYQGAADGDLKNEAAILFSNLKSFDTENVDIQFQPRLR